MPSLQIGDRAPDFSATAHNGQRISLADYRGRRGLVLFFYPKDGTSVCTKEACAFRDAYEKFAEAGAGLHQAALMYLGLVLFFITFVVLSLSKLLLQRMRKSEGTKA